jgi:tRNA G37 N-methylase Trm5
MSNLITKTTEMAMAITLDYVKPGDTVIDATCGTGQDTVALAKAVGSDGKVYAFDIQEEAIELTDERLRANDLHNVNLICDSFVSMNDHVASGASSAVVFNLGYLPGGDHSVTTEADETIKGLELALGAIKAGGIVTVVMYDGHEAGKEEKRSVLEWTEALNASQYHVAYVNMLNQKNNPPEIVWITKKG